MVRKLSRRKFLALGAVALGSVGGYRFLNNSFMDRLEEIGSLVPCDFHAHPSKNAPRESLLDLLGSEGLVGLATKPHRENFLSYDMAKKLVENDDSFREINPGHLAKFEKGYFMKAQEIFGGPHHVLCFGVEGNDLPNFDSYEEAVNVIHENNGVAVFCHPYLIECKEKLIGYKQAGQSEGEMISFAYKLADEVEVDNGQFLEHIPFVLDSRDFNELALEEARKHFHLKGLAVSDAHREPVQAKVKGVYIERKIIEVGMGKIKRAVIDGNFELYIDSEGEHEISRGSYFRGQVLDRFRWGS